MEIQAHYSSSSKRAMGNVRMRLYAQKITVKDSSEVWFNNKIFMN